MERREFLSATLGLSLLVALASAGCGGGHKSKDGSGRVYTVTTRATVQLPAGLPLAMSDLKAATAWSVETPGSDGNFRTRVLATDTPTMAFLRQASTNRLVLLGFVGENQAGVSPQGTAIALLALSLSARGLGYAGRREMNALLAQHPATATLAEVIARRIVANPLALTDSDGEILAALKTAFTTVMASAADRSRSRGRTRQASLAPQLTITPDAPLSEAQVEKGTSDATIRAVNRARRPCAAYTYRIAQIAEDGTRTDYPQAVRIGDAQNIAATASLVTGIVTLGTTPPWAPEYADAVQTPVANGAKETDYETVILMASSRADEEGEPDFFSQPRYSGELEDWRAKRAELNEHAFIGCILYDLVASAIGARAAAASYSYIAGLVAQVRAAAAAARTAELTEILAAARAGRLAFATEEIFKAIASGSSYLSQVATESLERLVAYLEAAGESVAQNTIREAAVGSALTDLAVIVAGVLATAGTLLSLVDLGVTSGTYLNSSKGERWLTKVTRASVAITPATTKIGKGRELTLKASVDGATDKALYRWQLSGGNGLASLRDASGHTGMSFETENSDVVLATTPSTQGTLTVRVQAIAVDATGTRSTIGEASSQITLSDEAEAIMGYEPPGNGSVVYDFFYEFPYNPTVKRYTLTLRYLPSGDERVFRLTAGSIGEPLDSSLPLNNDNQNVFPSYVSGSSRFPLAWRRGNRLLFSVVATGPYEESFDAFFARVKATYFDTTSFTVTTEF